ncbi:hypothetical protein QYE76_066112 [Lolium multiflorum]|uniref:Retrotransposon gag domain-containing protein n=1 Tax=Lolium multiflorum TaxID=4521 RepID=A0AAD8S9Z4_LOLMU|nr:hypothetical protein QYE76_066112 [Lolium multiflorum]
MSQSANSDGRGASDMTLTKWLDMKLDKFEGLGTPMDASSWLRTMEKYMDALVMTPEDRVVYVAFQLKGLADVWWEGVRKAWIPTLGALTWGLFVKQFTAKYYPASFREKMDVALRNIKQGNKTVDEYDAEFSRIVHFVDHINQNELEKARRFFEGLNSEYRHVMGANRPNDYFTVVEQARGMELQIQLTEAEAARTRGTSTGHKRSHQEGTELTKHPAFKKSKPNQQSQPTPETMSQLSSPPFHTGNQFMRPVPGQGMICFRLYPSPAEKSLTTPLPEPTTGSCVPSMDVRLHPRATCPSRTPRTGAHGKEIFRQQGTTALTALRFLASAGRLQVEPWTGSRTSRAGDGT